MAQWKCGIFTKPALRPTTTALRLAIYASISTNCDDHPILIFSIDPGQLNAPFRILVAINSRRQHRARQSAKPLLLVCQAHRRLPRTSYRPAPARRATSSSYAAYQAACKDLSRFAAQKALPAAVWKVRSPRGTSTRPAAGCLSWPGPRRSDATRPGKSARNALRTTA